MLSYFIRSVAFRHLRYSVGQSLLTIGVVGISVLLIIYLRTIIGGTQQRADVGARHRGAQCRDGLGETRLRQLNHIEIALADDGAPRLPDRVARLVQAVKFLALAEDRCLG